MKKNIIVGQSGGPTAVINASLYGVIKAGLERPEEIGSVYGMVNGIEGFMQDRYMNLSAKLNEEELEILKQTPAAYLGSCRYKLPEDLSDPFYPVIFQKLEQLQIGYFFYIGGNDSMDTVSKLSRYAAANGSEIRFIGIPKTIDNDLIHTDHTPGYGSAAKYVAATVREIALDASVYQQKAVTIVELMGRHAGWLTAASVLARKEVGDNPLLVYLPEADFDLEQFALDVKAALDQQPNVVVCVSEGISDKDGTFICEYGSAAQTDSFGHKMLTGSGKVLEAFIRNRYGVKVRSVELNVSQRCSGMVVSMTDIEEAAEAGRAGVAAALKGSTGQMIAFRRKDGETYELECVTEDVNLICNQEKKFPTEWITKNGTDIGPEFWDYALPLIRGEAKRKMKDGLPVYLYRK
ncbi:MAG: 6-phosphofructokinase [Lachnospiraceae bacterium]|nr:6-phosphofructokinase [Lachnospiraceae bacterium]